MPITLPEIVFMNISRELHNQSKINGDKLFITDLGTDFTYGEAEKLVAQCAAMLHNLGLTKGDRVATQLFNSIDFVVIYNAVIR